MDVITATATPSVRPKESAIATSIPATNAAAFLMAMLLVPQLLLWCFLGLSPMLIAAGAMGSCALVVAYLRVSGSTANERLHGRLIGACFLVSLTVFLLGGEGRFFYANADWQVRNAVLHDLVAYPWPFAYAANAQVDLLRAPLGLYLVPAAVGKEMGLRAAELAMLVQSAAILTCILALSSTLFDEKRDRIVALLVFLFFSGMDILGMALMGKNLRWHLETWGSFQFSSHLTQAFWVPMHALAGWIGATLYLLWYRQRLPLSSFLTPLPLLALLSPLALIGVIPFAAHAALKAFWSRTLRPVDLALPLASVALSFPGLLYLASGTSAVQSTARTPHFVQWALFETIEVLPYLVAVVLTCRKSRFGSTMPLLVSSVLLLLPLGQIGTSGDFTMRASIPALAILSMLVAEFLLGREHHSPILFITVVSALMIGSLTPATEISHALMRPRQPMSRCSYFGVVPGGAPTYVTPLAAAVRAIAPSDPVLIRPNDPATCREVSLQQVEERFEGPLVRRTGG